MKNYLILPIAALMMSTVAFTSCSDDDDDNKGGQNTEYANRNFGNEAINSCDALCKELEKANTAIASTKLSDAQEAYLRNVLSNLTDRVIIPTYKELADDVEDLEKDLYGLTVETITQDRINSACEEFLEARENWERSEAFLMGAASDFDIDPTIDSWPLNRTLLLSSFNAGTTDNIEDQSILGFHALEFILFRDGKPRKVAEFKGYDTYKNFTGVSGAQELAYAQTVCKLLKERTFQLQVAWEGETAANAARVAVVKAANLDYKTINGLSYRENLLSAGKDPKSTFATIQEAIAQVLSEDEGSCFGIANEVGTAKIANPFSAGDISYVESPYSYNSITDFQDNIRSIRNVWYGSTDGKAAEMSFHGFFANLTGGAATNTAVENAINNAIGKIGGMPSPFVKYVSTIWNLAFEDDEDWETEE